MTIDAAMTRKYSSLGPSVSLRATPRWSFLSSAATNVSKLLAVSVAIAAAIITAVSVHNLYPVEDPITPIGYLDREVNPCLCCKQLVHFLVKAR